MIVVRTVCRRVATAAALLLMACTPAARPLHGVPVPSRLPAAMLPLAPTIYRFTWSYRDDTFEANGEGAVRAQGPERARLDFFLRNGMAGGFAILVGDSLTVPGIDLVKRMLPPVPLLWASLGRLALPPARDTVARRAGDTLFVDMGVLGGRDAAGADGRAWRVAFVGDRLSAVDRIEGGRVVERLERRPTPEGALAVSYAHVRGKRRLQITVTDSSRVDAFDEAIWRRP